MASKYPCKHGTVMEAGDGSHEQLKKSLKFAVRMNEATTLVTSFLSSHQMPNGRTNLLANFRTRIVPE